MMLTYLWLLKICPNLKTVEHKYLLRGHTHMEADHIHALIERSLKKQPTMEICTPWDWQTINKVYRCNRYKTRSFRF
nr:unnamed protein product [Callosobruchus chinensis]